MTTFEEALDKHFRFYGVNDVLPFGLRNRRRNQNGRVLLARVMADMGFHNGLEIGCDRGGSAAMWCETIPGLHLTCIDPYTVYRARRSQTKQDQIYRIAQRRLQPYDVTILRESSLDVADRFDNESVDFIHIDGDHSFDAVVQDIIKYVPKVRKGGLVTLHDYCSFYLAGVLPAVDAYTRCHCIDRWYITHDDPAPTAFWQRGEERLQ